MSPTHSQTVSLSLTVEAMPDADMERFNRTLKDTASGLRLRLAITEAGIAIKMVRRILRENGRLQDVGSNSYAALQAWRRQYIRASEIGSDAIDQLWRSHRWPADAGRTQYYQFKPKDAA
jgi:hypothetical protein